MGQVQRSSVLALLVVALALSVSEIADAQLTYRYYRKSCPNVEKIIYKEVKKAFNKDNTIAPGILRLIFHDCFVRGCDASVLLAGPGTERTSPVNTGLHGFEAIDAIKAAVEKECPNTVSCADILAYASRDTVRVTGGKSWKVPAGRRDGTVSLAIEVAQNLPPATAQASELISTFAQKGLTPEQMVILSGSHTLGVTHCIHLRDRIFSPIDPTMPKDLLKQMQRTCPTLFTPTPIVIDRHSVHKFDTQYFKNIANGKGIMTSDQTLYNDESTRRFVLKNLKQSTFVHRFGKAMFAMTNIQPTVYPDGEIRKKCQFVN
jgi:peroxidase